MLSCNPLAACIAAMQARSNQAKESTEGTTMTTAIEVTKREMYEALANMRGRIEINHSIKDMLCGVDEFEHTLEDHLEELRKAMVAINESTVACMRQSSVAFLELERRVETQAVELEALHETARKRFEDIQSLEAANAELERCNGNQYQTIIAHFNEIDALKSRVQVLEMANATSGEVIRSLRQEVVILKREASQARKNLMAARLLDLAASVSVPPYSASGAALDANTATILGALVGAQRIMTDYLVPDGIRAKDAMGKIIPVLDNEKLCLAMDAFEKPKCDHFTDSGEGGMCRKCGEQVYYWRSGK